MILLPAYEEEQKRYTITPFIASTLPLQLRPIKTTPLSGHLEGKLKTLHRD